MPHLVVALAHSAVRIKGYPNDFQVVAAIFAETNTFNRAAALSQLYQERLPVNFTVNLIGLGPIKKRFTLLGIQPIRVDWKEKRYGWQTLATIRGYGRVAYKTLVTGIILDLKDRTKNVLASTFDVSLDKVYFFKDFDQNVQGEVFREWEKALMPSTKALL